MTTNSLRPADIPCPVVLVTGFLGSGKTTLLRELLRSLPSEVHSVVLMNEFGKVGIDGPLLGEELDIVEVNRGSIFCACAKGDFLKALNRIARDFDADLLFVEASGIADPSDFERDLNRPEIASAFLLSSHLCVIDAACFPKWAELFTACEKQARSAHVFVLNKCDEATEADLCEVEALLAKWNPQAPVYRTSFGKIDPSKVLPDIS